MKIIIFILCLVLTITSMAQEKKIRARDLGIPFDGTPGKYNAITDVAGVEVGHTTIIDGNGKLEKGKGPVRTGVTASVIRRKIRIQSPVEWVITSIGLAPNAWL